VAKSREANVEIRSDQKRRPIFRAVEMFTVAAVSVEMDSQIVCDRERESVRGCGLGYERLPQRMLRKSSNWRIASMSVWRKFSAGSLSWLSVSCPVCKYGATFTRVSPEAVFHHCAGSELAPLAVVNGPAETPARKSVIERAVQDRSDVESAVAL
jgi:hypothetical protein